MDVGQIPREDAEALAAIFNATLAGLIDLAETRDSPLSVDWIMGYIERFLFKTLQTE